MLSPVARRLFQLAAGFVLILVTLTPLMECFDHWDKNAVPANDTELNITGWLIGAGIALAMAKLPRYIPTITASQKSSGRPRQAAAALRAVATNRPAPTGSPPPIPLRI
jgi:hypothetical protein